MKPSGDRHSGRTRQYHSNVDADTEMPTMESWKITSRTDTMKESEESKEQYTGKVFKERTYSKSVTCYYGYGRK